MLSSKIAAILLALVFAVYTFDGVSGQAPAAAPGALPGGLPVGVPEIPWEDMRNTAQAAFTPALSAIRKSLTDWLATWPIEQKK